MPWRSRPARPRQRSRPRPRSRPRLLWPSPHPPPLQPPRQRPTSAEVQWSPELQSLDQVLRTSPLPQLVRCRSHVLRGGDPDSRPFPLALDKPILLADRRTAGHLLARIVSFDDRSRTFSESVDTVVIPEDYEGNFLRLQCRTTKDKSRVQSLDSIAHDNAAAAFFNLSDLTSFPAGPRDPGDRSKFIYTVGNVFLVDEPPGLSPPASDVSGNSRHSSSKSDNSKGPGSNGLMRCLDERGVAVVLPTDQTGEVVAVQKNADLRPTLSVKSSELITAGEPFPVLARYAYGKRPFRLTACSKLFTLLDSFVETTVIACVIDGSTVVLMELPMTSSLQFQVALNSEELLRLPRMGSALHVCLTRGWELARDVKFKLKFSHRLQETSRRRMEEEEEEKERGEGAPPGETSPTRSFRTRLVVTETYVYI